MAIGAQELVDAAAERGCFEEQIDCVFATSLIDAAALRAGLPKGFRDIPLVLYMHENQVAYPSCDPRDASFAFTNLQSVLTADLAIFNSQWNLDSFIDGISSLLKQSPDTTLGDVEARIGNNATVAWVPVEAPPVDSRVLHNTNLKGRSIPTTVVWPHRWEHDKGPDRLLEIAREYTEPLNLRWIILGEQFSDIPESVRTFSDEFADRIDHMGYVESKGEYWHWLHKADWVLSTANHEFFGIAVVEALFAGCLPWLPEKLSYRELLPDCGRGLTPANPPEDPEPVKEAIAAHLKTACAPQAVDRIDQLIVNTLKNSSLIHVS